MAGAACHGEILDDSTASAATEAGPSFASDQEMLEWVAELAVEAPLATAEVQRDGAGRVTSIGFTSEEDRQVMVERLGGAGGYFTIDGERHSVDFLRADGPGDLGEAGGAVEAAAQLVRSGLRSQERKCGGSFCTSNESWNTHRGVSRLSYHSVGASTTQTSGGFTEITYQPIPDPNFRCPTRCSSIPRICRPGDTRRTTRTGDVCVSRRGDNALGIEVMWFSNGATVYQGTAVRRNAPSVSLSRRSFGVLKGPCRIPPPNAGVAECDINGVCAFHSSFGAGGATQAVTGAGSYNCPFSIR